MVFALHQPRQSIAIARPARDSCSIVSFGFDMDDIHPETIVSIRTCEKGRNSIYVTGDNSFQAFMSMCLCALMGSNHCRALRILFRGSVLNFSMLGMAFPSG